MSINLTIGEKEYFPNIKKIEYEGRDSDNPLAFKFYDSERIVSGKPMREHLKFAVAYWHTFCGTGGDPFGPGTKNFPWEVPGNSMQSAYARLDAAFEFFTKLGVEYYCFHDRDLAPEGNNVNESVKMLQELTKAAYRKQKDSGVKLLWGTANLFSHPRFMNGAATNPDFNVITFAASQVKAALDATIELGGSNYVFWGGREGYSSLLNTDMKKELDHLAIFLSKARDYGRENGFNGTFLIEPKPMEPSKHQYDFDSASCLAFLRKAGLENEIKLNIEANHATLSGHSFEHEIVYAIANNALGSLDINRGDTLLGWDTDQFPNSVLELILPFYHIFSNGGIGKGGLNFDAKIRRQSIDPEDLFYAHIGGMDICAKTLLAVEKMINDKKLSDYVTKRYEDWQKDLGNYIYNKGTTLDSIHQKVLDENIEPKPRSGNQEYLENILNKYL